MSSRFPRLKQSIDVFPRADGRIHLYRGGDDDYVIEGDDGQVLELLRSLDGTRALTEIAARVQQAGHAVDGAEIAGAIRELTELGLVEDAADDQVLGPAARERYDRQLRYFGDCAPPGSSRAKYQLRLQRASVVVLGLGGLGGWAALGLASAGVGRLVLVDGDAVELSNLNRQVLYDEADIGAQKAEAAAARLRRFNSELRVEPQACWLTAPGQIEQIVAGADFVVDAVDTPVHDIERWVNAACFAARVPYIMMSQFPPLVRFGPTFVPGETGCYACQETEWHARYPLFDELSAHRRQHPCPAASFGPASGLIGAQVAGEVAHFVSGLARPATQGRSLTLDMRTMEIRSDPVIAASGCAICRAA